MAELATYDVTLPSGYVTQMRLDDAEAQRRGLKKPSEQTPARTTEEPEPEPEPEGKSRSASNKSRGADNK